MSKSPCLHPGDVRKLTAVDVQKLSHMKDVIVFPQKVRIVKYINSEVHVTVTYQLKYFCTVTVLL